MKKELLTKAYKEMLRIRLVEERLVKEYLENNIRSFVHFYIGQEAVAVGVCMNLTKKDYAFGTHRCHGHYLAKGGDLKKMIAELYGKATGCSKGRGGSMHLIDRSAGYMGSISILSSVVPIATGAAFAQKYRRDGRVTAVFMGDGAADEGGFYESINLAALMEVPVLFVVENNLYAGMSDANARHPKEYNLERVVLGLGGCYYKVDGNDWADVYSAAKVAVQTVRAGNPVVMECMTYRHMAHSAPIFDDELGYRKADDMKTRLEACPLKKIIESNEYLIEDGILDIIEYKIRTEIDKAVRFAEESPYPLAQQLTDGVYYE